MSTPGGVTGRFFPVSRWERPENESRITANGFAHPIIHQVIMSRHRHTECVKLGKKEKDGNKPRGERSKRHQPRGKRDLCERLPNKAKTTLVD